MSRFLGADSPICSGLIVGIVAVMAVTAAAQTGQQDKVPVLVELFTSEGCSSCPPADALLAKLEREQPVAGAEIIVLEEHVDYWESLGWHDRFSSHQFTDRQSQYARHIGPDDSYTPQMIVDGSDQFVGNDASHALRSIAKAAGVSKVALKLASVMVDGDHIAGSVSVSSGHAGQGDVFAVVVEKMASTSVLRGENGGRTLHHVSVVRSMQKIGSLDALAHNPISFTVPNPAGSTAGNLRLVLFAQKPGQGAVLGVASTALSPARSTTSMASAQ
jgi:hypothetical protein